MASARGSVVQRTTFTLTVTSSSIAVATSLSTQASTKFAIGDRVYVSSGPLNVRKQPRTNSAKLGTQPTGAQGAVVGGPIFRSNYWWWKINYDTGADGWSIENFLEKVSPIPTPTPTPTPAPTITDFDFFLANGGLKSTNQGSFVTNFVTATLVSGTSQSVSFSTSGLPAGATATFSPTSCSPACSSTFTISTLSTTPAGNYTITVTGTATGGLIKTTPFTLTVIGVDTIAPSIPTGLIATAVSSSQINLSWTASTDNVGVAGYKVFRGGVQIAIVITGTSYQNTGLTASTIYSYTVSAYDAAGNNSAQSSSVSATTQSAISAKFVIGDRVQVSSGPLNVRATPSISGTILGVQATGAFGTVIGGSVSADGYNWWQINYATGADGWSTEDFLAIVMNLDAINLPICTASLQTPETTITYYVATNEQGANNELCDGLAPTNEGGNRCPFKDFASLRVREKLFSTADGNFGTKSVTVKVRAGTYFIHPLQLFPSEPLQPLLINANGQSENESVVLMNYNGEQAILDGTCPSNISGCDFPENPGKIWTILEIYGSNIIIQGLTFDNAYGRNIQIGAADTHIRCNKLIGSYGSDSDSIKATSGEGPVYIYGNEFSGPNEQAIDGTKARDWIIENNTVRDGGGFGFKFEALNVLMRNNSFINLRSPGVIALGADGSSPHAKEYEAYYIRAKNNTFAGVKKPDIFGHCYDCAFSGNSVSGAEAGVHFGDEHPGYPDGCQNGTWCLPSTNASFFNNRFRDIRGLEGFNNVFVVADALRIIEFAAGNNLYCVPSGEQPIFWRGGVVPQDLIYDLATWQERSGIDYGSEVLAATDPKCTSW
ncbi:MAG: Exoglucanase A [Candidatus Giovannonibacteria bacterium GW2011_GWA2_44_13b]|uniref:Exoglucanase A n=1 Tax=Candidatus Giovannonibacteria bacterium GW2011_GWA2_44_13b TaxID=1618647 RepID=A0A0G1GYD6_9BACT|nr:MAG: Exoglucanase A [Candidatus Giovannonibacteria bacterium GW2011_GWA2_44_13b]